jgi:phosphatidate phosphatase APP1
MASWKTQIIRLLNQAEERIDQGKFHFKQRFGLLKPFQILPYYGYGTGQFIYLKARVLEETGVLQAGEHDTPWNNLANMVRRFSSDELGGARVLARFQDAEVQVLADKEGFLEVQLTPTQPLDLLKIWHEITLELLDPQHSSQEQPARATGYVIVPPPQAEFGVISDIDDTIIQTGATSLLTMARIVFFSNARSRLPFEGVSAFYRALQQGRCKETYNPIFYVSSSPWNLYDLLIDFFMIQRIPIGPLFLQNYGLATDQFFMTSHEKHKLDQIEAILMTYPELPFILIGDSGQQDPEIYREVTRRHPGRIRAIYIRDVMLKERGNEVQMVAKEVGQTGVEMLLVSDTFMAALHAADHGFIDTDNLLDILAEKEKDAHAPVSSLLRSEA